MAAGVLSRSLRLVCSSRQLLLVIREGKHAGGVRPPRSTLAEILMVVLQVLPFPVMKGWLFALAASLLVYPLELKTPVVTCDGRTVLTRTLAEGTHAYLNQNWAGREKMNRHYYSRPLKKPAALLPKFFSFLQHLCSWAGLV